MALRVTTSQKKEESYPLSFNDIKNKKGMYEHRNGKILVVYSNATQFITCDKRQTRTGFTRTGMAMIQDGAMRLVVCDQSRDGDKNWREYTGSITLAGNPHVVDDEQAEAAEQRGDDDLNDN